MVVSRPTTECGGGKKIPGEPGQERPEGSRPSRYTGAESRNPHQCAAELQRAVIEARDGLPRRRASSPAPGNRYARNRPITVRCNPKGGAGLLSIRRKSHALSWCRFAGLAVAVPLLSLRVAGQRVMQPMAG